MGGPANPMERGNGRAGDADGLHRRHVRALLAVERSDFRKRGLPKFLDGPVLTVSGGGSVGNNAGLQVFFAGSISGGTPPYGYTWTFADGTSFSAVSPAATLPSTDATTEGDWTNLYGNVGYNIAQMTTSLPSSVAVTFVGSSPIPFTWAASTTESRALLIPGGAPGTRIASCWYAATFFTIDIQITDGLTYPVSLYALDWEPTNRSEQIQVIDVPTSTVLHTFTVGSFSGGEYVTWYTSGHVHFVVTNLLGTTNAVVSGIFIGSPSGGPWAADSAHTYSVRGHIPPH